MELKEPYKILWQLWGLLWERTPLLPTPLYIPDTICIEDDIVDWYFTSKDGKIKRKLRENLRKEKVLQKFCRIAQKANTDIVAVLIFLENMNAVDRQAEEILGTRLAKTAPLHPVITQKIQPLTSIQYLTKPDLGTLDLTRTVSCFTATTSIDSRNITKLCATSRRSKQ